MTSFRSPTCILCFYIDYDSFNNFKNIDTKIVRWLNAEYYSLFTDCSFPSALKCIDDLHEIQICTNKILIHFIIITRDVMDATCLRNVQLSLMMKQFEPIQC